MGNSSFSTVGQVLNKFNPIEDKYISREFQHFGYHIAEELNDTRHTSLYIKLAKTVPRALLEKALSYVSDAKVRKKGALFMWKLKEMGAWKDKVKSQKSPASPGTGRAKVKIKVEDIPF